MTVDCPLTCYICGRTKAEWMTVDLIGCFSDQESASTSFTNKFGREPESFLHVCVDCQIKFPIHTQKGESTYGVCS